jgi:alpha-beta hydrolase superfamily lysophospholipase
MGSKHTTQENLSMIATTPSQQDYWRVYHEADDLARADALRTSYKVASTGVTLNVDTYDQPDPSAPVFIFNHGGGGYSRLFVPLALALYDRGYTVVIPDQRGQGLSEGDRSDFTVGQFAQNILDVSHWARERYSGALVLAGASLGSALVYHAAAAGAPVDAVVCHNLYDLGSPADSLAFTHFAFLAPIAAPFVAMTGALARIAPTLRLPYRPLSDFRAMVDKRAPNFYDQWRRDPYPIREITLRYLGSVGNTPPPVPLEANPLPLLVINPTRDQMVAPSVTRRNYDRLGGPKQYAEIDYGHWMVGGGFEAEWAALVDGFVRGVLRG